MLFIDTETTGLLPHGRMASIAVLDELNTVFFSYVRPDGWTMPAEAEAINGLSTAFLERHGRPIADIVDDLKRVFADHDELWAHNPKFDVGIIRGEFERVGEPNPFECYLIKCTGMATRAMMGLSNEYRSDGTPRIASLKNCLKLIGELNPEGLHGAEVDAGFVRELVEVLHLRHTEG